MAKIRAKGQSEADITLEQLLRYGRTLESTIQQSLVISNSVHRTSTASTASGNAVSSRQQHRPLSRRLDRCDRVIQNEGDDSIGGNG